MTALRTIAAASLLVLGFGAVANAQTADQSYWADQPTLESGRSVYVDRAPATDAEADQTVMGLRVPYGPRYR